MRLLRLEEDLDYVPPTVKRVEILGKQVDYIRKLTEIEIEMLSHTDKGDLYEQKKVIDELKFLRFNTEARLALLESQLEEHEKPPVRRLRINEK